MLRHLARRRNEGGPPDRIPLVPFCTNDSDQLLASTQTIQDCCDVVDLNLGCPREIAMSGHHGSFLQAKCSISF